MMLSEDQVASYHERGFLLVESLFSPADVGLLRSESDILSRLDSPRRILESDGSVRAVLGPHQVSDRFARLSRLDKIIAPVRQLIGCHEFYIHQTKVNLKPALSGDRWDWHQDLYYWQKQDGFPGSGAVSVGIFLDDVDAYSGPLMLIPGSHLHGVVPLPVHESYRNAVSWEASFSSQLTYRLDAHTLHGLLREREVFQATGRAGFVVFFNDMVFHGSNTNMSSRSRTAVYLTYNAIANRPGPVADPRPTFAASRDFTPVFETVHQLT